MTPSQTAERLDSYTGLLEHVACNLCGADDAREIYPARYDHTSAASLVEKYRSSGDEVLIDRLVRCNRCGLQYLDPRPRADVILEGYSEGSDENFVSQVAGRERTSERCLDVIERHAGRRGRILDIGTAAGSFLHVARRRGWQVAGCEPNRWLCDWARENYGLSVHPGTLVDMPDTRAAGFDVVTLWDVLEHLADPRATLAECRRLLKPGGILVVNYPDVGSWIARLMGRRWVFLLSVHLYYFTPATIERLLDDTGFDPVGRRPHFQTLELGYILFRARAYVPWAYPLASRLARLLRAERLHVPYWIGQTLVVARRR